VHVDSPVRMHVVARTRDDAAGEAFDKTARLLGLPFPGGPAVDRLARAGDPRAHAFPRHRATGESLDMSFSGIKTAVKYFLETEAGRVASRADIAASFQAAVVDVLIDRLDRAAKRAPYRAAILSGGVAANSALQAAFRAWGERAGLPVLVPELRFCTDNAAMIAAAADRQGARVLADVRTLAADPNLPFLLPEPAPA
jgi:N6-L-threonylcarbamoyladenine synthase